MAPSATYLCFSLMTPFVSAQAPEKDQGMSSQKKEEFCSEFNEEEVRDKCDPNPGNWDQPCDDACTDIVAKYKEMCTPEHKFWKDDKETTIHEYLNTFAAMCKDECAGGWNGAKTATIEACNKDFKSDGCVSECNAAMLYAKDNKGKCSTKYYNDDMSGAVEALDCGNACMRQGMLSLVMCRHQGGQTGQCSEDCKEKFLNFLENCDAGADATQQMTPAVNSSINDVARHFARRCSSNCRTGILSVHEACHRADGDCRACKDAAEKADGECVGDIEKYRQIPALQAALGNVKSEMSNVVGSCWHIDAQCVRVKWDFLSNQGVQPVPCPFSMAEREATMGNNEENTQNAVATTQTPQGNTQDAVATTGGP